MTKKQRRCRFYEVIAYEGRKEKIITKVEVYDDKGVRYYQMSESEDSLIPETDEPTPYFSIGNNNYNWTKIPLVVFKYNVKEISLINMVKSLQDGLNLIESNFQNNMETEFQAALEDLIYFINCHLFNTGKGDYEDEPVDVVFNRDVMTNKIERELQWYICKAARKRLCKIPHK